MNRRYLNAANVSIFVLLGACAPNNGATAATSVILDEWIAKNVSVGEKVICKKEVNGEFFFLARDGGKVKAASRLDMSAYRQTHSFLLGWTFHNEQDNPLVTDIPPATLKSEYVKSGGKTYAERIYFQTLNLTGSKEMNVVVNIKKCPTVECDRQQTRSTQEKQYEIDLCKVPLK
jgi:hypothetical protein